MKDGIDDDEDRDEPIIEIMENVSGVPGRTEYKGWGIVLDLAFWASWALGEDQLFDTRHC